MSQFILFDAVGCFNEIGEWLRDLVRLTPPTFAEFVRCVWSFKYPNRKRSDWEKERPRFESEYKANPDPWNREYCDALERHNCLYESQSGWRVAFARANRVAMYLNNGDVHALKTEHDYLWHKLPWLWEGFCAIRKKAGLGCSTPPWRKSGKCILPIVGDDELRAFEADVLELADEFELMRAVGSLHFAKPSEQWEPSSSAWFLPTYSEHLPEIAFDNDRCCAFEFVPFPSRVRVEFQIWDESSLQGREYLKCRNCGQGHLAYHAPRGYVSAIAQCYPNRLEALEWQVQRKDRLLRSLAAFRESWECLQDVVRHAQPFSEDDPERYALPSEEPEKAVALAKGLLLNDEKALIELAEEDPRVKPLLPLARDLVEHEPGAGGDGDYEHELFRQERELLYAAIPPEKLAALPAPVDPFFGFDACLDDYRECSDSPDSERDASWPGSVGDENRRPDSQASRSQAGADAAEPVEDGNRNDKRRGMPREEANERARRILPEYVRKHGRLPPVREAARMIGCAAGAVSRLPIYRAIKERLDAGQRPKKPKTVSLTPEVLATTGRDDEELKRLMADRQANFEPSPLEDDAPGEPRRLYRPK